MHHGLINRKSRIYSKKKDLKGEKIKYGKVYKTNLEKEQYILYLIYIDNL